MKRSLTETIIGLVVLVAAGAFISYSIKTADISDGVGYTITADFQGIGSLKVGDSVRISGVKVGTISTIELVPDRYVARVSINVREQYKIPYDTAAIITSESLLGGQYLSLEPGGDIEMLEDGDAIEFTQSPQNLEQLLGKFIFSMQNDDDKGGSDESANEEL